MAVNISNVYISTFENNLRHLAQQSITRLRPYVMERATNGKDHAWETMGANIAGASGDAAVPKTTSRVATPEDDSDWGRRLSLAGTWHTGDTTEQEDPVQMLVDPNSNVAHSLAMKMRRTFDDVLIEAASGDSRDGDGNVVAFDTGQEFGDGTTIFSFDLVTNVQEIFMNNDIENDVPKVAIVPPVAVRKLMQMTEMTSKDFVRTGLDQLSTTGMVPNWLGFTWIMSTRLQDPVGGDASRDCLFFTKKAIGLQVNKDITARIAEDPTLSFLWRVYCHMTIGAIRVEDQQLVKVTIKNALS